jgi:hypothetical protein
MKKLKSQRTNGVSLGDANVPIADIEVFHASNNIAQLVCFQHYGMEVLS